jgi:hypothetical protein
MRLANDRGQTLAGAALGTCSLSSNQTRRTHIQFTFSQNISTKNLPSVSQFGSCCRS